MTPPRMKPATMFFVGIMAILGAGVLQIIITMLSGQQTSLWIANLPMGLFSFLAWLQVTAHYLGIALIAAGILARYLTEGPGR
ncbi:MAG: hypothetical protein Q4F67_11105 [Propionibacteriaceae bacterium]|nr:hypothetical protein [Propionibacteriaceae bacterium]